MFQAAKRAGWLPTDDALKPKVTHVGFGLVLGEDGKRFRTRSSEVVRLVDLLDEAKDRSKTALLERGMILSGPCSTIYYCSVILYLPFISKDVFIFRGEILFRIILDNT